MAVVTVVAIMLAEITTILTMEQDLVEVAKMVLAEVMEQATVAALTARQVGQIQMAQVV
jgi:hypothetical protein